MITSVANQRVKDAVALQRKKERDATGLYLVEGPNAVAEAVAEGIARVVFATEERFADHDEPAGAEVVAVADHVLDKIASTRTPQGVVAVAEQRPATLDDVVGAGFLLVCDDVSDPGNAGTIIRTADAAGARGVVLTSGSVDPYNPKAVRASTGSITRVPVVTDVPLETVLDACQAADQRVLALDAAGEPLFADERLVTAPVALIFGSEAHGLPATATARADAVVAIPRYGRAESLNLAAAVAVASYAAARVVHGTSAPAAHQPVGTADPARERT